MFNTLILINKQGGAFVTSYQQHIGILEKQWLIMQTTVLVFTLLLPHCAIVYFLVLQSKWILTIEIFFLEYSLFSLLI